MIDVYKASNMNFSMNDEFPLRPDLPPPEVLEELVDAMPPKVPLRHYYTALKSMRLKGYSYAEIADWVSATLGMKVTRSQVSYVLNAPAEVMEAEENAEEAERLADEAEEN